jgi:hypothetical protein
MMDTTVCPECAGPAEVLDRTVLESTDGPVEHARILCVRRHRFFLPLSMLGSEPGPVGRSAPAMAPPVAAIPSDRDGRLLPGTVTTYVSERPRA